MYWYKIASGLYSSYTETIVGSPVVYDESSFIELVEKVRAEVKENDPRFPVSETELGEILIADHGFIELEIEVQYWRE